MTVTRTWMGLAETLAQFLDDYRIPEPRAAYLHVNANAIDILVDGHGATADLISESLLWETSINGITTAHINIDGTAITIIVYENGDNG